MIYNFDGKITAPGGVIILGEDEKPIWIKGLIIGALMNGADAEADTMLDKVRKWKLAFAIEAGGDIDLTDEQVELIKTSVERMKVWGPAVVGPVITLFDK